ncbi:DUF1403 family protein [Sedimentitalea sp. XS_ASV28]|uniref:DUF1403 family protein n=1 Tax=Sedimentitalea sp. XS_ASV28 TaxID=3241296 RepID=UPI003513EE0B
MNYAHYATATALKTPILPGWIVGRGTQVTPESAGFVSGSALALLHATLSNRAIDVPIDLLRQRLAVRAAVQCLKLQGRNESEGETRDAFHLTQAGDPMGPAGDMLAFWKEGLNRSGRGDTWQTELVSKFPEFMQDDFAEGFQRATDFEPASPVSRVAVFLSDVLTAHPRQEAEALLAADCLLSSELGWEKPFPLIVSHMKRPAIRGLLNDGDKGGFEIACHNAVAASAQEALRLAFDLARRAEALRTVAPKLRAKGSDDAVALFLAEDAVFPSTMLTPTIRGTRTQMSEQAARRLCDRLIELGVVRELTGRPTFRLYGV